MRLDPLLYDVQYDADTGEMSFYDKSGGLIYSCVLERGNPQPLTLEALEDGSTVALKSVGSVQSGYQTSLDGGATWEDYSASTATPITLNAGEKVCFRKSTPRGGSAFSSSRYLQFVMTGRISASGNCYSLITPDFKDIKDLTQVTNASGTVVGAQYGLYSLFKDCTSLESAPDLQASVVSQDCYAYMFSGCTALKETPKLRVQKVYRESLSHMFENCTSLVRAQDLPLEVALLGAECCWDMFAGCSSLSTPPQIPCNKPDAANAFWGMFSRCLNLSESPVIGTQVLADRQCNGMFSMCDSNPKKVICLSTDVSASNCTYLWLEQSSEAGEFYTYPSMSWTSGTSGLPSNWTRKSVGELFEDPNIQDDPSKPLMFYSSIRGSSISYTKSGGDDTTNPDLEYSNDGMVWKPFPADLTLVLDKGQSVYVRTSSDTYAPVYNGSASNAVYKKFNISGVVAAYHNVHSILKKEFPSVQSPMLYSLFKSCKGLVKAPLLPATILCDYCYTSAFNSCDILTIPPVLPATTLADSCYYLMFLNCVSLEESPVLPATELVRYCYYFTFSGCSKLSKVTCYATDLSASNCTQRWLSGVSATGDFYADPSATWATGISGIPSGWTRHDIAELEA